MTQRQGYRVKLNADFTYRPDPTWHRDYKAGFEGAVTQPEFDAMMAAGVAEDKSRKATGKQSLPVEPEAEA